MPNTLRSRDLTALKRAAREGHMPAIEELAKISMDSHPKLARLIPYMQKLQHGVPNDPDPMLISTALAQFHALCYAFVNQLTPLSPSALKKNFDSNSPWLMYFLHHYPLDLTIPIDENDGLLKATTLTRHFASIPALVVEMSNIRDFVGSIARIYLLAASVTCDSEILCSTSHILRLVMYHADFLTSSDWSSEVYQALHHNPPPGLAPNTVQRMIELSEEPGIPHIGNLIARLEVMLLCSGNEPELMLAFWARKSVSWVTYVMGRLIKQRDEHQPKPDQTRAADLCALYLRKNLRWGFTWVCESLDRHLIEIVIKAQVYIGQQSAPATTAGTIESVLVEILDIVTLMSVYRNVLRRAVRSVRKVSSMEEVQTLRGPLREAWLRLQETTERYSSFRPVYRIAKSQACANPGCSKSNAQRKDMRCSGCQYAYYCSHECAKAGWRGGHRKQCLELQRQWAAGNPRLMSPMEDEWFICLAQQEIYHNPHKLRAMMTAYCRLHPSLPEYLVLVHVDFTVLPRPSLKVMSVDEFVRGRDMKYYPPERVIEMVKASPGKFVVGITVTDRDLKPHNCLSLSHLAESAESIYY